MMLEPPAEPVTAAGTPPEEAVDLFIVCFLTPAAWDHKLNSYEETPLEVAFHALGIAELYLDERERPRLKDRFREAVRTASLGERHHPTCDELQRACDRIRAGYRKVSENDWSALERWFSGFSFTGPMGDLSGVSSGPPVPGNEKPLFSAMLREANLESEVGQSVACRETLPDAPSEPPASAALEAPLVVERKNDEDPPTPLYEVKRADYRGVVDGTLEARLTSRAQDIVASVQRKFDESSNALYLFDDCRGSFSEMVVRAESTSAGVWFVGDLHGDILALECILGHVQQHTADGSPARIVFLGDLIDDGPNAHLVVLRFMELLQDRSIAVCLIAGNHDESLRHDVLSDRFVSSVCPSDFTDYLNEYRAEIPPRGTIVEVGRKFIELVRRAPRALVFADGLLAAHGGVPQSDQWRETGFEGPEALNRPECLTDFVWTRPHERAQRRIPDRRSRGAEIGIADFSGFCEAAERCLGQPVRRMIRGHDHIDGRDRYSLYRNYKTHRIVTINGMSSRLPREFGDGFVRRPCVALGRENELPEVHVLRIPDDVVMTFHSRQAFEPGTAAGGAG